MLYREIIAVCSQIHTKDINTLCGQNVELLNVKLAVHIVTTGLHTVNTYSYGTLANSVTFFSSPQILHAEISHSFRHFSISDR